MNALSLSPRAVAHALGGEAFGNTVTAPGPGHSRRDRSLVITIKPDAPDGFLVDSLAGDPWTACKDHVRDRLGWLTSTTNLSRRRDILPDGKKAAAGGKDDDAERITRPLAIWEESRPPAGTPVETYLQRRGLTLLDGAEEALAYHAYTPFSGRRTPAMVALVRDVVTDAPKAIHRTALTLDGFKVKIDSKDKMAFGPIAGGAVKITPDEEVTLALGLGEGIESTLSLRELPEFGASPVWALLSAGGLADFPVLGGIEALWIAVDRDPAGERAARTCADRWRIAGREVFCVTPKTGKSDLNDVAKGRRRHAG